MNNWLLRGHGHSARLSRVYSGSMARVHNARLQPPAARNVRFEHDARIEGAPSVGCEPLLCDPRP
jgi:hypothetical protein